MTNFAPRLLPTRLDASRLDATRLRAIRSRRGTTVVETAFVLPIFLMFVLGIIELGHAQLVKNVLRSACREAARIGSTEGHSTGEVTQRVKDLIGTTCDVAAVQVFVKDASGFDGNSNMPTDAATLEGLPGIQLTEAAPRQLFLVRAKVNYSDVAIVPNIPYLGSFLDDVVLEGQSFMRHE
jgi:Flp pilus assembly protein TadG